MLSDLYSDAPNATPTEPGFLARDILRFIAVDIILMAFLRLFLGMGFFAGPGEYVAGILIGKLLLLAYLVWLIRHRPDGWTATGIAAGGRWWGWLVAAGLYAAYYLSAPHIYTINQQLMTRLHAWLCWQYEAAPQDVMVFIFEDILTQPIRLLLIGFTIVAGPIMEELAFRGMGHDAYQRTCGVAIAIIWMGMLFGVFHFDVRWILPLGLLGIVFGIARAASRTLWCPILIHCFHNGLVLWEMGRELSRL